MSTTVAPKPGPSPMAKLLKEWKRNARRWEQRAKEARQAAQLANASRDHWRDKARTAERRHLIAQSELAQVRAEVERVRAALTEGPRP